MVLLGALVFALNPPRPKLVPAPLGPVPAGCPKGPRDFTPSSYTEITGLSFDGLEQKEKNRALLELNMKPCPCGCGQSLAACRVFDPGCETSQAVARKVVAARQRDKRP